jgi:1-acyl-sn-glycerol-3-phosphate acyltransferase
MKRLREGLSYLWYEGNYWLSLAVLKLAFSLRTEGEENVPRTGPALLIANHQSFLDSVPIGLAARRHLVYLARQTLYRFRLLAWIMRSLNAIPINQEGFAREGLKAILEQLQAGQAVLIYPEGQRTSDGKLQPLRPGIHLLIKRVDMPIIPVGIAGAYEAWPRSRRLPRLAPLLWPARPGTVGVSIGAPIPSSRFADMPREQVMEELFAELQRMKDRAEDLRRR